MKVMIFEQLGAGHIEELWPWPYIPDVGDEVHWNIKRDSHDPHGIAYNVRVGIVRKRVFDSAKHTLFIILKGPGSA